jgi:diacylglycerol kinase (ATP)
VFVNPAAGGRRARNYLPQVRKVFAAASIPAEFISTQSSQDLESAAAAAISDGKRLLLSLGGDGTFQALVNAAYGADVVVGVLPAGGGNDFAAALQIPADPVRAATTLLNGEPRWVDLLRARTADGRERIYVGGGGLGIDAEAARYASGFFRHLPGRSRYVASALRAFMGFRPIEVRAEFSPSSLPPIESKCLLAAALNTPSYGAGIRLAPDAKLDDGWLEAVFVKDLNILEVLSLLPRLMKTGELHPRYVKRVRVQSLKFITDQACVFHGDGEILGPTPVEIEIVPKAIRVLAPAAR